MATPPIKLIRFNFEVILEDGRVAEVEGEVEGMLASLTSKPLEEFLQLELKPYTSQLARVLKYPGGGS